MDTKIYKFLNRFIIQIYENRHVIQIATAREHILSMIGNYCGTI